MDADVQKEIISCLIEAYKAMPYLWKYNHVDSKNLKKKEEGFLILLQIYKKIDPAATLPTLIIFIENLKNKYFNEVEKVLESSLAPEITVIYESDLWYFESLSFLGRNSDLQLRANDDTDYSNPSSDDVESNGECSRRKKRKNRRRSKKDSSAERARNRNEKVEPYDVYLQSIGQQLKEVDEEQLPLLQKLIAEAICFAKLRRLTVTSFIIPKFSDSNDQDVDEKSFALLRILKPQAGASSNQANLLPQNQTGANETGTKSDQRVYKYVQAVNVPQATANNVVTNQFTTSITQSPSRAALLNQNASTLQQPVANYQVSFTRPPLLVQRPNHPLPTHYTLAPNQQLPQQSPTQCTLVEPNANSQWIEQ